MLIVNGSIKELGEKDAVVRTKIQYEEEVNKIKASLNITDDEIKTYKAVSLELSKKEALIEESSLKLENLNTEYYKAGTSDVVDFYVDIRLTPTINNLPEDVQKRLIKH